MTYLDKESGGTAGGEGGEAKPRIKNETSFFRKTENLQPFQGKKPQKSASSGGEHLPVEKVFEALLTQAEKYNASDIHIKSGTKPHIKIGSDIFPTNFQTFHDEDVERIINVIRKPLPSFLNTNAETVMRAGNEPQRGKFEIDCSYTNGLSGRYRVNIFSERSRPSIALRLLPSSPPSLKEIGAPPILESFANLRHGLVVVTGPTGSGKTTTLASILHAINSSRRAIIITIEDPVEILHEDINSVIFQREVGVDTESFQSGVYAALRQTPQVIMIGEVRDAETLRAALQAAETGHLVFCTAHTLNVVETMNRFVGMFPEGEREHGKQVLAGSLHAIVCQRLIRSAINPNSRVPIFEILVNKSERVTKALLESRGGTSLHTIMKDNKHDGMQTFDQNLERLILSQQISLEDGLVAATVPQDLKMNVSKHVHLEK